MSKTIIQTFFHFDIFEFIGSIGLLVFIGLFIRLKGGYDV